MALTHLTASGNISASGTITAEHFHSSDDITIANGGQLFLDGGSDTYLTTDGENNTIKFYANNEEHMKLNNAYGIRVTGNISSSGAINTLSHITASGNISSSGQLIATSADFNDGNISNVGIIDLDTIRGDGDTNTNIAFSGDDVMTFKVGNEAVLTLTQGDGSLGDIVSVGDGGDVNFRVRTNGENNTIFVEGSSNNVGIGNSTPPKKLTVEGDISASGALNVTGDITSSGNFRGNRRFNKTSSTIADHSGDIVYFGGTTSMDNGKIYHFKNDGTWEIANADAASTSDGLLGVALGTSSDVDGVLLRGTVTLDHDPGAIGAVLFLQSDNAGTPGQATPTAPAANNNVVRVVGYLLDSTNHQIWFNPSSTFVEVSA